MIVEVKQSLPSAGENRIAYNLDFWYKNAKDVVTINHLRLKFNGRIAWVDHLVAVPAGLLLLKPCDGPKDPCGDIKNAIDQVKNIYGHLKVSMPRIAPVIVLLSGERRQSCFQSLHISELRDFIQECRSTDPAPGEDLATELVYELIPFHTPDPSSDPAAVPLVDRIRLDPEKEVYFCSFCDSELTLRSLHGELVWSCSQCENMVPATIAIKVGSKARDPKIKGLLGLFLSSRARICPSCGAILRKNESLCPNADICKHRKRSALK